MTLAALALPGAAAAQAGSAGDPGVVRRRLGGSAQTPNGDVALRASLKIQDGKLGGVIESSMGPIPIVASTFADGKLR